MAETAALVDRTADSSQPSTAQAIFASSTKTRIAALNSLRRLVDERELPEREISEVLTLLFATCALYHDRESHHAAQRFIRAVAQNPTAEICLGAFVEQLAKESLKHTRATSDLGQLTTWSSLLTEACCDNATLWSKWGVATATANAYSLEACMGSNGRQSVKRSALIATRRAVRRLSKVGDGDTDRLSELIRKFTSQGASSPKYAIYLGVIAGVGARIENARVKVEATKSSYYDYYRREFLGARTALPPHLAEGLRDFFANFAASEDVKDEILPALQKSLLRSPEVILSGLSSSLFDSLPADGDLSAVLSPDFFKALLSNAKSTNANVRAGVLSTFRAVAFRARGDAIVEKVATDIATPLKQGKTLNTEQKVLHAEMLSCLHSRSGGAMQKICTSLAEVAVKEPSELVLLALTKALSLHLHRAFSQSLAIDASVGDAIVKGLSDKKPSVRRLWALAVGQSLWNLLPAELNQASTVAFMRKMLQRLRVSYDELLASSSPATQVCLAPLGYVFVALARETASLVTEDVLPASTSNSLKAAQILLVEPKPSFLLNHRVYSKFTQADDCIWAVRALTSVNPMLESLEADSAAHDAWSQAMIYLTVAEGLPFEARRESIAALARIYYERPSLIGAIMIHGMWSWILRETSHEKDTAATTSKSDRSRLGQVLQSICPRYEQSSLSGKRVEQQVREKQQIELLVLCRTELIPGCSWIESCLKVSIDPGILVGGNADQCVQQVLKFTTGTKYGANPAVKLAACRAAADLVFVAPDIMTPLINHQFQRDLDPSRLEKIGPVEAAIYQTPEGTLCVDVLSSSSSRTQLHKNSKDYDTLMWEEELRSQLAQKKGSERKLTGEEQSKVKVQLAKESEIRRTMGAIRTDLERGVGLIDALANGPPIDPLAWMQPAVDSLLLSITAGAERMLGGTLSTTLIECAQHVSPRLGTMRPLIAVAILRALNKSQVAPEFSVEPLKDLVTRILYRLRFTSEQRPFNDASLIYILPLIFLVLENGGVGASVADDVDEQIVLALEFLSFHTDNFSLDQLPRKRVLICLITNLQKRQQHFKLVKDNLLNVCRSVAPNITAEETKILAQGVIVPESAIRNTLLQAIDEELDLSSSEPCLEVWIACHDNDQENIDLAKTIWEESGFDANPTLIPQLIPCLQKKDAQLRRATAKSISAVVSKHKNEFAGTLERLRELYLSAAKIKEPERDGYGLIRKVEQTDLWEARQGVAFAFGELATSVPPKEVPSFIQFLLESGALGDRNDSVWNAMIDAAKRVIALRGRAKVEELMSLLEHVWENPNHSDASFDKVNEASIIIYGALAQHLPADDKRITIVVKRLLATLSTPSESVQFAVAECLPALVEASSSQTSAYLEDVLDTLMNSKKYAARRGAAYGLAGITSGRGIIALREHRILSTLTSAAEHKKDANQRQGAFLAYELLASILGRVFEPYAIQIVPQILAGFGDSNTEVREACLDAAKACFSNLSSFGVKQVLPVLLEGLDEPQWRSKKGACDSLGAMAYLDPHQLSLSLPEIIPPLTTVLNDSHKEVRASAKRSLARFGDVISNPEIKGVIDILLKALSDPTNYTDNALDSLIKISFAHYLDAPSLALVVRILDRGLGDRSATKRKASQIIGSLAHLTERRDLIVHLPILVRGLKVAIVDPVPTTRATASKALGSTVAKLGEDALPDLIPSLMATLKSDVGAGDRLGSAQALSEVLAGLGTTRLEETLPMILQNVTSSKPSVREGFMSLFIYLPAGFGTSFAGYLGKIIPPILSGLADDVESIRETSLKAGRLLVKNFATRSIDLLLPELERGLAHDSHRIRLSSVELVGDLLFNLTGLDKLSEEEEIEDVTGEAGQSLLEVLGEEKRNKVLSSLYICRCDTSGLVRTASINVWKALVSTPRTLRELVPTLTQLIIRRLASSNKEQQHIAGNALGELIRKAGESVLATLLPTLEDGLINATDSDAKQGICVALRELVNSSSPESLEEYEKTLISAIRTALVDANSDVREAAADAFDALQRLLGKKAIDQILPHLLHLLRSPETADNALSALLTLLTDTSRSNIILPNLLPTLLTPPIGAFNARALASLSEVASSAMTRRMPNILNALMDSIIACKDDQLKGELEQSFDEILLSVDAADGINATMSAMISFARHDDHKKRATADLLLARFFAGTEIDISRYHADLIRVLLSSFDDRDSEVVKAAWTALTELTKSLEKEEMDALVVPTRQVIVSVGVAGVALPGFSLPKGIGAVLPIFLQGLMNGTAEQRTQSALAISDLIDRTSSEGLKPYVTQITGPLIRVVSERSVDVKSAILFTLNNLLEKIPTFLKPFLPQLQRTFTKSLADTTSETLRNRAAKALGTLITMTPRVDPLVAELVTGSKAEDPGVRNAMMRALFEVVSKAGHHMNETSRNSIVSILDSVTDDEMAIASSRLLGALVKTLPEEAANNMVKSRVMTQQVSKTSILALNAILLDAPEVLSSSTQEQIPVLLQRGVSSNSPDIQENSILAAGKYLLCSLTKSYEDSRLLFESLSNIVGPGNAIDSRRLGLVVIRTVSRAHNTDLVRPHIAQLTPPVFASVRDSVIPIKLAAEAAFLAIFDVVEEDSVVFDKYMSTGPGKDLAPGPKRVMTEYFKRITTKQGQQARERKEAEGGRGGLGLSNDEVEDEREVWSVGRVDLGDSSVFTE